MHCLWCKDLQSREISFARRVAIVVTALGLAAVLFHVQLAFILLERGDAYMSASDIHSAKKLYDRAYWFDRSSLLVAERRTFAAYLSGESSAMQDAIHSAHAVLESHPQTPDLLVNDALCAMRLHQYTEAAWAYERAGTLLQNPQYLVLAGWANRRLHRLHAARLLWSKALSLAPKYLPARFALQSGHLQSATVRL